MPEEDGPTMTPDEQLEHELAELAPLIRRRQRAETEGVDPAFALALERRLLGEQPPRSARPASRFPIVEHGPRWLLRWPALSAAALAAAVVFALLLPRHHAPAPRPVALAPRPALTDLTRDYPSFAVGGGGGGMEYPISTPLELSGGGYPVPLHLSAAHLPSASATLPDYRLARPSFSVPRVRRLAQRLGIAAPVTFWNDAAQIVPRSRATWIVAASGTPPSRLPLHSVAISLHTGELLYHDLRANPPAYRGETIQHHRAVALARTWLERLGWPGAAMPVLSVGPHTFSGPSSTASSLAVSFGWPRVGRSNVPAAVLWVAPSGRVVEGLLWPPIAQRRSVATRGIQTAWNLVRAGRAPIALHASVVGGFPSGTGAVRRVSVVQVLVTSQRGQPYLIPAYRFEGEVHLNGGQGTHAWYALAPAAGQ